MSSYIVTSANPRVTSIMTIEAFFLSAPTNYQNKLVLKNPEFKTECIKIYINYHDPGFILTYMFISVLENLHFMVFKKSFICSCLVSNMKKCVLNCDQRLP